MVFGESVLNDAVAIVLYKTIDRRGPAHGHAGTRRSSSAAHASADAAWRCRFNPRVCEPNCDVTFLAFLGAIWFFLKVRCATAMSYAARIAIPPVLHRCYAPNTSATVVPCAIHSAWAPYVRPFVVSAIRRIR